MQRSVNTYSAQTVSGNTTLKFDLHWLKQSFISTIRFGKIMCKMKRASWLLMSQYGRSPNAMTSHITMPKLHTSLADVNFLYAMASGAVQRMGIFPPWQKRNINKSYWMNECSGNVLCWKTNTLDWTLESGNTFNTLAFVENKTRVILCCWLLNCDNLLLLCRFPQRHSPAHAKAQNQTLYTPGCCWPEHFLLPSHGEHNSCQIGTSCQQLFHAASPQADMIESLHPDPIRKKYIY